LIIGKIVKIVEIAECENVGKLEELEIDNCSQSKASRHNSKMMESIGLGRMSWVSNKNMDATTTGCVFCHWNEVAALTNKWLPKC
jgi:hypothetical protein